jgi:aminopeptidase-like protein
MIDNTSGDEIYRLISDLYPLCRSITGNGLRESLRRLQHEIPLEIREVPSGTRVLDWIVPNEWNIRDAYVKDSTGTKVIDFRKSNLHVVNYSTPIHCQLSLAELKPHLFTLPEQPDLIPYRTSYYREFWGFCLSQNELSRLADDVYEVFIDSTLETGSLTYGEYCVPGQSEEEVLISTHCCHPSLCNDNLSGVALSAFLARALSRRTLRYTYRFLFIPGTIGSIAWLSLNEAHVARIRHGLVVACVGDPGPMTYKKSRRGDAEIDRAAQHVLAHSGQPYAVQPFSPYGYDERQYCSPGFNLPVGSLTRTPHGRFPEYHTSADNLSLVRPEALADSFATYLAVFKLLENNHRYLNTNPKGEPQLGRRGLYSMFGGRKDSDDLERAILWVLTLSDGSHDLLDIAERSEITFGTIRTAADLLARQGLLSNLPA